MSDSFRVIGRNIFPNECFKYKQKQHSRKLFNTNWLSAGEYQHEIGNHYRDCKKGQKYHRIRKKVLFEDELCNYRDVLHVKRIDFPPSTSNYSRVGYQVNSRLQPLDTVYDDTVRRIISANKLSELQFLTKRQERLCKFRKGLNSTQIIANASKAKYNINRQSRRALGHIRFEIFESTCAQHQLVYEQPQISVENLAHDKGVPVETFFEGDTSDDKDSHFLHLASECYNEGFLAHIKYLESIGVRNAINNQISIRTKPRYISENTSPTSRPESAGSNVSSSNSVEKLSNRIVVSGFISAVKRILQNRRFGHNPCNYDESVHGVIQNDWKIRVNITRSSSPESLHSSHSSIQGSQDNIEANHCIMSNISNSNEGQPQQISDSNGSSVKHQHFHNLIENLNNLEISELGSLPKIVLTDFSTSNSVVDSALPLRTKSHDNTLIKQQSLDVDITSLSDYNSEARPPQY